MYFLSFCLDLNIPPGGVINKDDVFVFLPYNKLLQVQVLILKFIFLFQIHNYIPSVFFIG